MIEPIQRLKALDGQKLSNEETNKLTKECIRTALILLMSEKPFDTISITEIVKRSGVSRTAFYRNFSSKEDVLSDLSDVICQMAAELIWKAICRDQPYQMCCDLFQMVRDNQEDFDTFFKAGLQKNGWINFSSYLDKKHFPLDARSRYAILGWWGAIENILLDWYHCGMREEIPDMADLCCQLLSRTPIRQNPYWHRMEENEPNQNQNEKNQTCTKGESI
ncbi:MAG: TetR/AcrR family transcriptional regulator [Lachnospiraceae bacterium]|nr:TetR/AcrR family transcriptional regulator [Lachnospiraceae bacterium]